MEALAGLVAFGAGWLLAQVLKLLGAVMKGRGRLKLREVLRNFTRSGGMPSGHMASLGGLVTYLGLWQGFDSAVFVLGVGMIMLVAYDAAGVRHAVGEIGKEVNTLSGKKMRVREGHTLAQVLVGAVLGVAIGGVVWLVVR